MKTLVSISEDYTDLDELIRKLKIIISNMFLSSDIYSLGAEKLLLKEIFTNVFGITSYNSKHKIKVHLITIFDIFEADELILVKRGDILNLNTFFDADKTIK